MDPRPGVSSGPEAPAWRARTRVAHDVDEHAAQLSGWRQQYDQLGAGAFQGRLDEAVGDGVQLFREQTSHALRQRCELWPGALWCGITAVQDGSRLDGRTGADGGVMVSGSGFELVSPAGHDIIGFVVGREVLLRHAEARGQALDLGGCDQPGWRVLDPAQRGAALVQARAILALAAALPAAAVAGEALRAAMLDVAADLFGAPVDPRRARGNATARRRLVQQVRERLEASPASAPSVPELCASLHVSRRTLQYAFEDEVGVSPLAYLRSLRLNGVRRLLSAGCDAPGAERPLTVADAAGRWGYWNLSQFASDYRRQFGERASDTLARARQPR